MECDGKGGRAPWSELGGWSGDARVGGLFALLFILSMIKSMRKKRDLGSGGAREDSQLIHKIRARTHHMVLFCIN